MGDSEATRERILNAATEEFAAYGLAGARVDRIAEAAAANKNRIYAYFESKEGLFHTVIERSIMNLYESVPFTAEDLPDYAVRLFDFITSNPNPVRLVAWFGLESRADWGNWSRTSKGAMDVKSDAIAKAQRDGFVERELSPKSVLILVVSLASAWSVANPSNQLIDPGALRRRAETRKTLHLAVSKLSQARSKTTARS